MDVKEIGWGIVEWIYLAQDRVIGGISWAR